MAATNTINVEIVSKELIKPSSPTPDHLRIYKRSFLDQISPPNHVPFVFFYPSDSPQNTRDYSHSLKQSLSEILTTFYPLAGRILDDGVSVDCNDAGVEFVEARVEAQFEQVLQNPNEDELAKFLPINPYNLHTQNLGLLAVQLNIFDCGSLVLAVCVSHRVADGLSMVSFIRSWSSQALGQPELIKTPDFESGHKLFPPVDLSGFHRDHTAQEPVVTKRLVFDKTKISNLKKEMTNGKITPTRVEAVSAFIWKQIIRSSQAKNVSNDEKLYIGVHSVNLRARANPPLGEEAFGNIWINVSAVSAGGDDQVAEFREAIKKIDGDYVKSLEDGENYMNYVKKLTAEAAKGGNMEFVGFSSWCRFPFYEVDFGFGKPAWVCITSIPVKNFGILMSTRDGDGIEVWLSTVEADMVALEAQIKLI
jgi:hypothetical protein